MWCKSRVTALRAVTDLTAVTALTVVTPHTAVTARTAVTALKAVTADTVDNVPLQSTKNTKIPAGLVANLHNYPSFTLETARMQH